MEAGAGPPPPTAGRLGVDGCASRQPPEQLPRLPGGEARALRTKDAEASLQRGAAPGEGAPGEGAPFPMPRPHPARWQTPRGLVRCPARAQPGAHVVQDRGGRRASLDSAEGLGRMRRRHRERGSCRHREPRPWRASSPISSLKLWSREEPSGLKVGGPGPSSALGTGHWSPCPAPRWTRPAQTRTHPGLTLAMPLLHVSPRPRPRGGSFSASPAPGAGSRMSVSHLCSLPALRRET